MSLSPYCSLTVATVRAASPVARVDVSDLTDAELDLLSKAGPGDVIRVPPGWFDLTERDVERIRVPPGWFDLTERDVERIRVPPGWFDLTERDVSELTDTELCEQIRSLQGSVQYLAPTEILTLWSLLVDNSPPLNAAQAEKALEQVRAYLETL